jgi:hypothetical protein
MKPNFKVTFRCSCFKGVAEKLEYFLFFFLYLNLPGTYISQTEGFVHGNERKMGLCRALLAASIWKCVQETLVGISPWTQMHGARFSPFRFQYLALPVRLS